MTGFTLVAVCEGLYIVSQLLWARYFGCTYVYIYICIYIYIFFSKSWLFRLFFGHELLPSYMGRL